jgi:hypothetical protein
MGERPTFNKEKQVTQMQIEADEPRVLMVYRRGFLGRAFLYFMPAWLAVFAYFTAQKMALGKIATLPSWLLASLFLVLLVCAIRFMLTRLVVDIKCTDEGIVTKTIMGNRPMIAWSSLRCFSRTAERPPIGNTGWLISEGHPSYVISDVPAPQMERLEEIVRNHSTADVRRPERLKR